MLPIFALLWAFLTLIWSFYLSIYLFLSFQKKKDKLVSVCRLLPCEIHAIIKHLTFILLGEAKEFTGPLKQYEQECVIRIEVAGK